MVDPDLDGWLRSIRSKMLLKGRSLIYGRAHCKYSNTFGLASLALRQLKRIPYVLLANDKEPGFCAIQLGAFAHHETNLMKSDTYRAVRGDFIQIQAFKCSSFLNCFSFWEHLKK